MGQSTASWIKAIVIYVIIAAAFIAAAVYFYNTNEVFRSMFCNTAVSADAQMAAEIVDGSAGNAAKALEELEKAEIARAEFVGRLALGIMTFVILIQTLAFIVALVIFKGIGGSRLPLEIRFAKLESADIFLDVPLYLGLFGTVLSFLLINFNPQMGRAAAYSSTLIGIIFGVILRLIIQYPIKQKFISERRKDEKAA